MKKTFPKKLDPIEKDLPVLVKQGKSFGDQFYIVEISDDNDTIHIKVSDVESPNVIKKQFSAAEVKDIIGQDNLYENLLDVIEITEKGELKLVPILLEPEESKNDKPDEEEEEENPMLCK
jgi:hypothetical protein